MNSPEGKLILGQLASIAATQETMRSDVHEVQMSQARIEGATEVRSRELSQLKKDVAANSDWRKAAVGYAAGVAFMVALAVSLVSLYFKAPASTELDDIREELHNLNIETQRK